MGGEPRGRAHGAGAGSDDELASRQNACHFRDLMGLVPSRPNTAHCSRRSLPGCSGNLGVFVGVLFLAGCGAYPLLAGVQAASATAFPANPDCVPPACGGLMCAAALPRLEQEYQASWHTRVKPSGDNVSEDSAKLIGVSRATCIPQVPFAPALFRRMHNDLT